MNGYCDNTTRLCVCNSGFTGKKNTCWQALINKLFIIIHVYFFYLTVFLFLSVLICGCIVE